MYSPGDKIFAKVKGHPHWPSRINLLPPDVHIPKGKYPIFFYGTHEVYFLAPKDIYPYEKFKHKFAVRRNKPLFQIGLREIEDDPDILLYSKDPNAELFLARFYKFDSSDSGTKNLESRAVPATPPVAASALPVSNPNGSDKKLGPSTKRPINFDGEASQSPAKRARPERRQRTPAKELTVTPPPSDVKSASGRRQSGRSSQPPSVSLRSATPASSAPVNSPPPTTVPRVSILRLRLPLEEKSDRLRATALGASPSIATGTNTGLSSPSPFSSSTSPSSNVTVEAREHTQPASQQQQRNKQHLPHCSATTTTTTTTESVSLPSAQAGAASTASVTVSPATDPLRITIRQVPVAVPKAESNDASDAQSSTALVISSDSAGAGVAHRPILFSVTSSTLAGPGGAGGTAEDGRLLPTRKRSTAVVTPMRQESNRPPRAEATPTQELGDVKGNSTGHSLVRTSKLVDSGTPLSGSKRLPSADARKRAVDHVRSSSSKQSKHKRRSLMLIASDDDSDDDDYAKHKSKRLPRLTNTLRKPPRRMPNTSPFSTQSSPVDVGESDEFQRPTSVSSSVGTVSKMDANTAKSLESPVQSSITPKSSNEIFSASPTQQPLSSPAAGGQAGSASTVRQQQQERQLKELDAEARLLLIDRAIKSSLVRGNEDVATCVDRLEMLDRMVLTLPVIAKCWTVVETIRKCRRYKRSMEVKIAAQRVFNKFLQVYACADKFEMELAHTELLRLQERFISASASVPNQGNAQMDGVSQQALASYSVPKSMADLFQVSASTLAERRRQSTADLSGSNDTKEVTSAKTDEPAIASCDTDDNTLTLDDIPLPEESAVISTASSVDQAVRQTSTDESVATLVTSPLLLGCPSSRSIQHEMAEEFEVLDEYDEESQQFAFASQIQDDYSTEQGCEPEEPAEPDESADVYEDETEEGEVRDSVGVSPPPKQSRTDLARPSPSRFPAPDHQNRQQDAELFDGGHAGPPVAYVPQAPHSSHHHHYYQKAVVSNPSTSSEMNTPPQVASRAYIPHSLHPSNDPPPPYRPYNPNYVDRVKPVVFPRGDDLRDRREKRRHSSLGSPPTSSSSKENADHNQRVIFRSPLPLDSAPPHRARSPHALPHPLEHYQRCLTTALVSDEEEPVILERPHGRSQQRHVSRQYPNDDLGSRPQCAPPGAPDAFGNQLPPEDVGKQSSSCLEDLDTRIARMLSSNSSQSSSPKKVQDLVVQTSGGLTVGSPPPPPPPLPPSHRVIFTHRPPPPLPLPPHSFKKHRQQMAGPPPPAVPPPYQHRAPPPTGNRIPPTYRRHPPHPPSSVGPMQHRGPSTYLRDNRMHFIGGGGPECLPPHHPHHPRGQREGDAPPQSGYGRDFHSPPPGAAYPPNRNRRGSGQEKDREIYSMLGV